MSLKQSLGASLIVLAALMGPGGSAHGQGIVEKAGKDAGKGAVKGVQQELSADQLTKGAKQVTKGVMDGAADAAPMVTSQIVNQANVNKKAMGKVARQVSGQAVAGVLDVAGSEMFEALGEKGDGPFANTMVAMTERLTAAIVRGVKSETDFHVPVWPYVLAFVAGAISTFLCGFGLVLLYVLFQRRRVVAVATTTPPLRAQPAGSIG
jgi:hypothetical protein